MKFKEEKRRTYRGVLSKPSIPEIYELPMEEARRELRDEADAKRSAVNARELLLTLALMGHYGIEYGDEDAWQALAMRLADDHVPGFTFSRKRGKGRPTSRPSEQLVRLRQTHLEDRTWMERPGKGRPRSPTRRSQLAQELAHVLAICRDKKLSGRGSIKAAVKVLLGTRFDRVTALRMQRRISEAKKMFPEIVEKMTP